MLQHVHPDNIQFILHRNAQIIQEWTQLNQWKARGQVSAADADPKIATLQQILGESLQLLASLTEARETPVLVPAERILKGLPQELISDELRALCSQNIQLERHVKQQQEQQQQQQMLMMQQRAQQQAEAHARYGQQQAQPPRPGGNVHRMGDMGHPEMGHHGASQQAPSSGGIERSPYQGGHPQRMDMPPRSAPPPPGQFDPYNPNGRGPGDDHRALQHQEYSGGRAEMPSNLYGRSYEGSE